MTFMKDQLGPSRYDGDIKIVSISGDFTKETTPCVCNYIEGDIRSKKIKAVLLDFAEVDDIDTAAFACLVDVIKEHSKGLAGIGIINIKDKGGNLLEILRLQEVIKTYNSEEEALTYLKAL